MERLDHCKHKRNTCKTDSTGKKKSFHSEKILGVLKKVQAAMVSGYREGEHFRAKTMGSSMRPTVNVLQPLIRANRAASCTTTKLTETDKGSFHVSVRTTLITKE